LRSSTTPWRRDADFDELAKKPENAVLCHSGNLLAGIQKYAVSKQPAVYILSSKRNGTLYVGVTSDLVKRVWAHKNNLVEGFTKRYGVHQLVWYELHESMESAIKREKRLKDWKRKWKLQLIESANPNWEDLYPSIV
jgi:putative endonuclease